MAWTDSRVFRAALGDMLGNVAAMDLDADTFKVPLFTNAITPDKDVTADNSAYNVAQWATANETFEAGQWAQGGPALANISLDRSVSAVVFFDANDTASGSTADITNAYGCLVYDSTLSTPVANQGLSYNYFGGANSVVNGTFTVVWHANGIVRFTL